VPISRQSARGAATGGAVGTDLLNNSNLTDASPSALEELARHWKSAGCPKSEFGRGMASTDFLYFRELLWAGFTGESKDSDQRLLRLANAIEVDVDQLIDLLWRSPKEHPPHDGEIVWCLDGALDSPPFLAFRNGHLWFRTRFRSQATSTPVSLWMPDVGIVPPFDSRQRLRRRP
jgi:hypothetical protein